MINEEIFSEYIADPAAIRPADTRILEEAIEKYPYCHLLHAFHVKSLSGSSEIPQELLFKAALLSPDRRVLWKIIHQGESIRDKNTSIKSASLLAANAAAELELNKNEAEIDVPTTLSEQENHPNSQLALSANTDGGVDLTFASAPAESNLEAELQSDQNSLNSTMPTSEAAETNVEQITPDDKDQDIQDSKELQEILDNETQDERLDEEVIQTADSIHQEEEADHAAEEIREILEAEVPDTTETSAANDIPTADPIHQEQERDSASEEIQDILTPDQHNVSTGNENTASSDETLFVPDFTEPNAADLSTTETKVFEKENFSESSTEISESNDLDTLINAGIAQNYSLEDISSVNEPVENTITSLVEPAETQDVSPYTDDKMPYSFLWWLDKTRREHTQNYQPYTSNFKLDTSKSISRNAVDPLSSQIIENIFHLQSPIDQLENSPRTVAFQIKRKGDYILEKFIREEPQIKPPNSQKLDTENKARKSSEDPNDLVSETLAQIYIDQMLYHKAIETFKKLSLKFPEKSTYFADQIIDLEKKLN